MFSRAVVAVFSAVLAVGSVAALPGCDWFRSSDPAQRSSPTIDSLVVQPSSVLCAQEFSVTFHFEDPQGDLRNARVRFQRSGDATVREETPVWPDTISRSSGTVSFPFKFEPKPCTGQGGTWMITVEAQDDRDHTSNTLNGQITLNSAG